MNTITSSSNQYVKQVKELLRKPRARREFGRFVAEGERLLSEVPEELLDILFVAEDYRGRVPGTGNCRRFTVSPQVFRDMSDTENAQGILAVVKQVPEKPLQGDFFLILETLQDPGNLGTIFRTAEAAGVSGILMNRECADVYSPKVVRSTMGALFRMPFRIVEDLPREVQRLREEGVKVYAAHLRGEKPHFAFSYQGPTAFLIGNEGNGLSDRLADCADSFLRIPMRGKTESLNAAAASTVLMYEVLRQRMGTGFPVPEAQERSSV